MVELLVFSLLYPLISCEGISHAVAYNISNVIKNVLLFISHFYCRYGVEPPVLVKLEKEIELEETLLMGVEPAPAVKTFTVCCQHGSLYQGVSMKAKLTRPSTNHT